MRTARGGYPSPRGPLRIRGIALATLFPVGFLAFFAVILKFASIWRIYWLAGLCLVRAVAVAQIES